VIDSFGEQDNVVFLGRRSFRMEIVGRPDDDDLAIPEGATQAATRKLFMPDWVSRIGADAGTLEPVSPPEGGISWIALVALCLAAFALGIVLTLAFGRRPGPSEAAAPPAVASAPVAAPSSAVVAPPLPAAPAAAPKVAIVPFAPAPHPVAKPVRAAHPRPARPSAAPRAAAVPPAPVKPWVDPFAE